MSFKQYLTEALRRLPDEKIDDFIEREWGKGNAYTFEYNAIAALELAKIFPDILVTQDNEFMHIPSIIDMKQNSALNKIEQKYKLKAINESKITHKVIPTEKDLETLFNKAIGMFNLSVEVPDDNKIQAAVSSVNRRDFQNKFNLGGKGSEIVKIFHKFLGK